MTRHLTTFDQVLDALGGIGPTAILAGTLQRVVGEWRTNGKFPHYTRGRMQDELERRGFTASTWLWSCEVPRTTARRKQTAG
jgi:hypothetical protein